MGTMASMEARRTPRARRPASPRPGGAGRSPRWTGGVRPPVPLVWAAAALCSGLPSTVHALATGGDPLQATRAAATLVPCRRDCQDQRNRRDVRNRREVMTGAAVHLVVSAGWTAVLAAVDRRRGLGLLGGVKAGLLIAALDLEVIGRTRPAIHALPRLPQWLDHIAFGAIVGVLLGGRLEPGRPGS